MPRALKIVGVIIVAVVVVGGAAVAWRLYDRDPEIQAADVTPTPELVARGEISDTGRRLRGLPQRAGRQTLCRRLRLSSAVRHDLFDQHHAGQGDRHRHVER